MLAVRMPRNSATGTVDNLARHLTSQTLSGIGEKAAFT